MCIVPSTAALSEEVAAVIGPVQGSTATALLRDCARLTDADGLVRRVKSNRRPSQAWSWSAIDTRRVAVLSPIDAGAAPPMERVPSNPLQYRDAIFSQL